MSTKYTGINLNIDQHRKNLFRSSDLGNNNFTLGTNSLTEEEGGFTFPHWTSIIGNTLGAISDYQQGQRDYTAYSNIADKAEDLASGWDIRSTDYSNIGQSYLRGGTRFKNAVQSTTDAIHNTTQKTIAGFSANNIRSNSITKNLNDQVGDKIAATMPTLENELTKASLQWFGQSDQARLAYDELMASAATADGMATMSNKQIWEYIPQALGV